MKRMSFLACAVLAAAFATTPVLAEKIEREKLAAMAQFLPPPGDAKRQQGPASVRDDFSGITWNYNYGSDKRISVQLQAGKRFVDNFKPIVADKARAAALGYEIVKIKGKDGLFRAAPKKPGIDDDYSIIISETRQIIVKAKGVEAAALRSFVESIDLDGFAKAN